MILDSILDNDLYKFTMGQAVAQKFPHAQARYKFINRGKNKFTAGTAEKLKDAIANMADLKLTKSERQWLKKTCPYLTPVYIDLLSGYRYDPDEVKVFFLPSYQQDMEGSAIGDIEIEVTGPWYRAIYWEVPLMALLSEIHNETENPIEYNPHPMELTAALLDRSNCKFADFGTRRRFSKSHHANVISTISKAAKFVGTSNVHLAHTSGSTPIGTQAHEWIMFHGAKYGYHEANRRAMKNWVDVYHGDLGIVLTDTFGTSDFFKAFGSKYSKLFDGVRHDSGDPWAFTCEVGEHYEKMGINPKSKTIIFSDGLNTAKASDLQELCDEIGINCSFGIGTNLTNNIKGVTPLNMVIKMTECKPYGESEWLPVVKLSDDKGKHTGDPTEIELCKKITKYC